MPTEDEFLGSQGDQEDNPEKGSAPNVEGNRRAREGNAFNLLVKYKNFISPLIYISTTNYR